MNEEMRDAKWRKAKKAIERADAEHKRMMDARTMVGRAGKDGETAKKLTEEDLKKLGGLPVEERLAKVRLVPHRPRRRFKNRSRY